MTYEVPPEEFKSIVQDCYLGLDWAPEVLRKHDAAQRARIAELEAKLASLQHIGTGAGQAVNHKYE